MLQFGIRGADEMKIDNERVLSQAKCKCEMHSLMPLRMRAFLLTIAVCLASTFDILASSEFEPSKSANRVVRSSKWFSLGSGC